MLSFFAHGFTISAFVQGHLVHPSVGRAWKLHPVLVGGLGVVALGRPCATLALGAGAGAEPQGPLDG